MRIITDEGLLRKENKKVELVDMKKMHKLTANMLATMHKNKGCGIAAPQVGINKTLFIADLNGRILIAINPKIIQHSNETNIGPEGCLSVPDKEGMVPRYNWVKLKYINGKSPLPVTEVFSGHKARIVQHEYEHLEGKLYTDSAVNIMEVKKIS